MLVKWAVLTLLAAVTVAPHHDQSWNVSPMRTSNVKETRPHTPDIIHINPVPMQSNELREQNDAIAAVYGPAFLKDDWIWDGFNSQNKKYNPEHRENEGYQKLDINAHDINPIREENYNFEYEHNENSDVKYNQERGRIQTEVNIYEREQIPENRNWKSQVTEDTEQNNANVPSYDDYRKHENKKPIFPRLHQLRVDAKRVLESPISKIRALLPQLKHLEDKDIIHFLRDLDDRLLGGVGQRTKERIKNIREQVSRFESRKIERKPKQESTETVGNRLYPGYDEPSYPQEIRSAGGQYEEGVDYGAGNKETPHGWGRGDQPAWARLPEASFQGRTME